MLIIDICSVFHPVLDFDLYKTWKLVTMHHLIETSLTLVCLCNIKHLMSDPEGNS